MAEPRSERAYAACMGLHHRIIDSKIAAPSEIPSNLRFDLFSLIVAPEFRQLQ